MSSGSRLPAAAALVLACAASVPALADVIGPVDEPYFEQVVRASLELGEEPILLSGRAEWAFGVDEYRFNRIGTLHPVRGLLLLLETQLVMAIWDPPEQRYVRLLRIPYDDIADVRLRVWGASRRMVVETRRQTLHAFSFTSSGGVTVNAPRTVNGIEILKGKVGDEEGD